MCVTFFANAELDVQAYAQAAQSEVPIELFLEPVVALPEPEAPVFVELAVQPQQEEPPVISPSRWSWGRIAVVAGCVAVAIGYSVWSWRNSCKSLTKSLDVNSN